MVRKHFATILFITSSFASAFTWIGVNPEDYPARDQLASVHWVPLDVRAGRRGGFFFHLEGSDLQFQWPTSHPARDAIWQGLHAGTPVTVRYNDRDYGDGGVDALEIDDVHGRPIEPYDVAMEYDARSHMEMMAIATFLWLVAVMIAFLWARARSQGKPGTYWAAR